jgi:hypothetical protein
VSGVRGRHRPSRELLIEELEETRQRIAALRRDIDLLADTLQSSSGDGQEAAHDRLQRLRIVAAADQLPLRQQELTELLEREAVLSRSIPDPFSWRRTLDRVYRTVMALLAILAVAAIGLVLSGLLDKM